MFKVANQRSSKQENTEYVKEQYTKHIMKDFMGSIMKISQIHIRTGMHFVNMIIILFKTNSLIGHTQNVFII